MIDEAKAKSLMAMKPPKGVPFKITKIGHVVLNVCDVEASATFYVEMLGFSISDVYPSTMVPGGMVFMRYSPDHHGVALVGSAKSPSTRSELNHMAFEVTTLDEVFRARNRLRDAGARIIYEGRRRAGCQVAVEFLDPDGHHLEIYWGLDIVGQSGYVRPPSEWTQTKTLEAALTQFPPGQDTTLIDPSLGG